MNKSQLIELIAKGADLSLAKAGFALDACLDVIQQTVAQDEKVQIQGFGSFEKQARASRQGRNPTTGEPIDIAASNTVKFRPGNALKDAVNR